MKTVLLYTFLMVLKLGSSYLGDPKSKNTKVEVNTSTLNQQSLDFYQKGKIFFENKDYPTAILNLNKAIALDDKYVDAYDLLTDIYILQSEFLMAKFNANKSAELLPEGFKSNLNLGRIFESIRDFPTALTYYSKCTRLHPENPTGYYLTAKMNFVSNDFEKSLINALIAEKYYKKNKDIGILDAQYLIGMSYHGMNDTKRAKKYLIKAVDGGLQLPDEIRMTYGL
ncbi:MAG: tetratricopeptide repeat protein [Bacteroidetes bacterium]|nr:tetratricopeptide repeat protein [Bacteroidota bacterium]MBK9634654.1 tetratricopeptide repeat protein [Bacteroidota bacterium]MBL0079146.1 tetratricopeptide repeat protein [Bacteroidota bacterium]MBP7257216.1 tetratricopeptide repeat protein [Chitinophagales bacterium]